MARYANQAVQALWGLLVGLKVTLQHAFFRPTITLQYPRERTELPAGERGLPVLLSDPGSGKLNCIGCLRCEAACPTGAIEIRWHPAKSAEEPAPNLLKIKRVLDEYNLDVTRCMFCGLCAEACPFDALAMSDLYEMAATDLSDLVFDMERLAAIGRQQGTRVTGQTEKPYLALGGTHEIPAGRYPWPGSPETRGQAPPLPAKSGEAA